ncbi:DsbA family protein [Marinomonas sp. 15G1-11]|uniref:DsbA family protein n=1 Tax=Marinomonas phaeophyticola TaxID=3004091 RepID=A0ABT4JTT1_9GAMM|nr:DsbA family protein [Marinomonas sp. 15G1-11]MCZ2721806.1 DsbA family protein [Marinomonas sp. 15G1-11]
MSATLIYCYDPMCSWCWGFKPTWKALQKSLQPLIESRELSIDYMLGGLAVDSDEPMPTHMQTMLHGTWKRISEQLGTEFNFDFWTKCQPRRSTYPACRACLVARDHNLEAEMTLAIQQAYYLESKNPSDIETLSYCAKHIGLKSNEFQKAMQHTKDQGLLEKEISSARSLGLNSFPSLAVLKGDELIHIPLDYQSPTAMLTSIKEAIQ